MELYVHLPFCLKKCRYCDFVSFVCTETMMEKYIDSLLREAQQRMNDITEPIKTVYFGGGTPSLLPAVLLTKLIQGLKRVIPLNEVTEWTSEANPGTLTVSWLEAAYSGGINRLSLGMQAAQNHLLKTLGRIHTKKETQDSVILAQMTGFSNISLDLMFGLPSQTLKDWQDTLREALAFSPKHISAYGLIPEKGTPLRNDLEAGRVSLPEAEQEREMYEVLLQTLRENGFEQYEISNFSLPGYSCRHNIGYWTQVPYLGLGLSASSMLHPVCENGFSYCRRNNTKNLYTWLSGHYTESEETISPDESRFETMMLGMRMISGVSEIDFEKMHQVSLESCYGKRLRSLEERGLVQYQKPFWSLTRQGLDLQNMVLVELMDE